MRTLSKLHREWRKPQTAILDTHVLPSHDTKRGNVQESCTFCSLYQGHLSGLTRGWPWGRVWFEPVSVRTRKPNNVARIMQTNDAARFIDCENERNDSRCWMKSLTDFKLGATCANIVQQHLKWRQAIAACCVQHWCRAMSCQANMLRSFAPKVMADFCLVRWARQENCTDKGKGTKRRNNCWLY